jgi:hypothetical protein
MKTQRQRPKSTPEPLEVSQHAFLYDWFAFYQGWVEGRKLKGHHLRDGPAFLELSMALNDRGGRYGKLIRNGPATPERTRHYERIIRQRVEESANPLVEEIVAYHPVHESSLQKGKVLSIITRLPMNDFQQGDKVQVQPGFTSLEQKIIRACRPYLVVCARSRVRLAQAVAAGLPPEFADRADIQFRAYEEPWYTYLQSVTPGAKRRRPKSGPPRTAAYLLQLPEVAELNGVDLLVIWGQGGTQTLAFAQRLRSDLSYLLDHYGLSMVEMVGREPAAEPSREQQEMAPFRLLDEARDWKTLVLLQGVLLDANGERVSEPRAVRRGNRAASQQKASPMKPVRPESPGARRARSKA